jgi:hypothetical protein
MKCRSDGKEGELLREKIAGGAGAAGDVLLVPNFETVGASSPLSELTSLTHSPMATSDPSSSLSLSLIRPSLDLANKSADLVRFRFQDITRQ